MSWAKDRIGVSDIKLASGTPIDVRCEARSGERCRKADAIAEMFC